MPLVAVPSGVTLSTSPLPSRTGSASVPASVPEGAARSRPARDVHRDGRRRCGIRARAARRFLARCRLAHAVRVSVRVGPDAVAPRVPREMQAIVVPRRTAAARAHATRLARWRAAPSSRAPSRPAVSAGSERPRRTLTSAAARTTSISVTPFSWFIDSPTSREGAGARCRHDGRLAPARARSLRRRTVQTPGRLGWTPSGASQATNGGLAFPRGLDGHEGLQAQEPRFADASDVHQVLEAGEAAVLLAVLDDRLRRSRPDAG